MKRIIQSVQQFLSGDGLSGAFSEPAGQPDWQREYEKEEQRYRDAERAAQERTQRYYDVMLGRIARLSEQHKDSIQVPERLFHGGLRGGLKALDPEVGQGLGVWFQKDLIETAHYCVSRNTQTSTLTPYPNTAPSIYEVSLNVKKFAVFPDELSLYSLAIVEPGDDNDLRFYPPSELHNLHNVRRTLVAAGYDGIHLLDRQTFSALDSQAITIIREHDPIPLYNEHIRPKFEGSSFGDPYPWVPE